MFALKRIAKNYVLGLPGACALATLYGFAPTGALALALAVRAETLDGRGETAGRLSRRWLLATLLIGAALELPVIMVRVQ